jgi:hypothetical protein
MISLSPSRTLKALLSCALIAFGSLPWTSLHAQQVFRVTTIPEEAATEQVRKFTPLAAYLVTRDDALAARFTEQVLSGGTGINVFGFQAADATLPFGGVGPSGSGCHSGYEGFLNYSHQKSVFKCEDDNVLMMAIKPPFGELSQAFADAVLAPAT